MPDLHVPPREQSLLQMYAKGFLLLFEYQALVRSIDFERESFNVNLALSRLSMRYADTVRETALFPRLKGVHSKILVENAWQWSQALPSLRALSEAGIEACAVDGSALRLSSLVDMPRKMAAVGLFVKPLEYSRACRVLAGSGALVRDRLFKVRTMASKPSEGLIPFRDSSGVTLLIPEVELQFLMHCCNSIFLLEGNAFNDACLQWFMDAVDIVRNNSINWDRVAYLASSYGQTAILDYALAALKPYVSAGNAVCSSSVAAGPLVTGGSAFDATGTVTGSSDLSAAEAVALRRHALYLAADKRCRSLSAGTGLLNFSRRALNRLKANHFDLSRFYPRRRFLSLLALTPRYYCHKYFRASRRT